MNKLAWTVITDLCGGIGTAFVVCLIFGSWERRDMIWLGVIAILGILGSLIVGKIFFPF